MLSGSSGKFCRQLVAMAVLVAISQTASAAKWLDKVRAADLNDYAIGATVSTGQNLYKGSERSSYLYPYLTNFKDSAFTNNWIVVGEGDLGFRFVRSNWTFGAVGRIQTRSPGDNDELNDIKQRKWALELAPSVEYRAWPIHIRFKTYFEPLDRHDGTISQLEFAYPWEWTRGYIRPAIEFIYQSSDYSQYYYGVLDSEETSSRAAYDAGGASNLALKFKWGYSLSDRWLLTGRVGLEYLDDEISNSPIVARDKIWTGSLGLAYKSGVFQPTTSSKSASSEPRWKLKVLVLDDHINTTITSDPLSVIPGEELDLEDFLQVSDRETVIQYDIAVRLGTYHRIELSYMDIERSGSTQINMGNTLRTEIETSILRLSYGYSVIRDSQKELGFIIGVHNSDFDTRFSVPETGEEKTSDPSPVLPVLGMFGSIRLGQYTAISAEVQIFRMDFDRYDGSLSYIRLELQRRLGMFDVGLGYSYYAMNLDSQNTDLQGTIKFRHRGPTLSATVRF
jgi:outer membrane protein